MSTITRYSQPLYGRGEQVYLRESAVIGFVESYFVDSVEFAPSGEPVYVLRTRSNEPQNLATVGDQITGPKFVPVKILESGLVTYEEALDLAIENTQSLLTKLIADRNRLDEST